MKKTIELCKHCKGPVSECGGKTFQKEYECSKCGMCWFDGWCCACNDKCPNCNTETEPLSFIEV